MRIRIWSNIRHAVSKSGHFTHDMTFFHHDVRGKRFNTHGESHCMEMTISKDHVAEKPRRGGTSGGMVAHDLVNGCQATARRDERSEPPEAPSPPGRVQGRHKHHHDYLRNKLSGRGHGKIRNLLIIRYHFNRSVETQAFFGHVSTPRFITL